MRSSRCGAAAFAVAGALLACSGAKPKTVAPGAAVSSGDAGGVPVWPVRWLGWFPSNGFDNVVSPDGRWAVVTPLPPMAEPEPTLFRLGPDGPVAPLSAFVGTKVIYPRWLSDSRRVRLLLRGEPRDIDNRDATPALLDLETLGLTHEKNYPFDPVEGRSTAPNSDCSSASDEAPMLVCQSGRRFVVAERKGEKVERNGPTFECDGSNSSFVHAPSGTAALGRCKDELLIARPNVPVVRFRLDERFRQFPVLVWGEGARSFAYGGKPNCAFDGRCADPGAPHVFDAATGKEISPDGFRPDGAPWVVTALGSKLWADHRSEPLRRPLPGLPLLLKGRNVRWISETRVSIQAAVPPPYDESRATWREVELDLGTGRVLSSRSTTPPVRQDVRNPPWGALQGYPEEDEHGDIRPARIVREGRVVSTGYFLDQERDLISLRTGEHLIELFSEDGRRLGRLSEDNGTVPFLSPSGAIGIQVLNEIATLVRIATGEALSILLVRRGERTFGVVTSHAGWFAGDPEAFDTLRFASGKKLLDAVPLTGTDVRSGFERPSLLGDFLAGRSVPLEPARPLKQAALGPVVVPTRPSTAPAPSAAPLPATKASSASSASVDFPKKTWLVPFFGTYQHQAASWSPDGRFAVLRQPGERAILFDAERGAPVAGLPIVGERHWAIWSPDRKRILAVDHREKPHFTLVELATFEHASSFTLDPAPPETQAAVPVGFLPDGKSFVARLTRRSARVLDASSGAPHGPEIRTADGGVLALAWTHPYLAHALEKGGFAVTDVDSGRLLFTSERPIEAAEWLTTEPKLAVKSGISTLVWDPKHGLVELDGSGDVTWDPRGDRLALFTPDPTGGGEIDRCTDCLRPVRNSRVFDVVSGRELVSNEFSPGGRRYGITDFSILDFQTNEARPFPPAPNHPWGSSRWNGDGKVIRSTQRWTTTIALETGRVESWVERDPHANLRWGKEAGTSVDGTKQPPRPFTKASLMFAMLSPSGRFVVGGGEPPGAILRVSDGAMLRLLVVETKERPYSVLIDEAGRYAGDDEAARYLSYATGTSLRDVTLANGLDVADRFRKPDAIRAFFRP